MELMSFFSVFSTDVSAFFTDRSYDFTLREPLADFTIENNDYLKREISLRPQHWLQIRQVHGDQVVVARQENLPWPTRLPEADALVTACPNVALLVRTADCLPVFLFDPRSRVIALVHAGWRGTQKEILIKTLRVMKECGGTSAADVRVALGPAIRSCCYEVGVEFKTSFAKDLHERAGRLYFDLIGANTRQLQGQGVLGEHIQDTGVCTCCTPALFSFRREGPSAGRHLSLLMLRQTEPRFDKRDIQF